MNPSIIIRYLRFVVKTHENIMNTAVGVKVQNSCGLGLGLARVQIDKYWILVFIREPKFPMRYE